MNKILQWFYSTKILKTIISMFFRDISGYEGMYQINRYGTVKSLSRIGFNGSGHFTSKEIILKQSISKGYNKVQLRKNNKSKSYRISTLVFRAFKPNVILNNGEVIGHMNNKRSDDSIYNLQALTQRENCSKNKRIASSKYLGVYWSNTFNKWIATIHIAKADRYLGRFDLEHEAAQTYKLAVKNVSLYENPKQFRILLRREFNQLRSI